MKKILFPLLAVLLIVAASFLLINDKKTAPPFTLKTLDGQTITQAQLKGHVSLINFWYPSCPGCVIEIPKLIKLHQQINNKNYQTLAISLNYNTPEEVRAYSQTRKLPFTVLYDTDNQVSEQYGVQLAPASFLIDSQGHIIRSYVGEPNWGELKQRIDQLLSQTH